MMYKSNNANAFIYSTVLMNATTFEYIDYMQTKASYLDQQLSH